MKQRIGEARTRRKQNKKKKRIVTEEERFNCRHRSMFKTSSAGASANYRIRVCHAFPESYLPPSCVPVRVPYNIY